MIEKIKKDEKEYLENIANAKVVFEKKGFEINDNKRTYHRMQTAQENGRRQDANQKEGANPKIQGVGRTSTSIIRRVEISQ